LVDVWAELLVRLLADLMVPKKDATMDVRLGLLMVLLKGIDKAYSKEYKLVDHLGFEVVEELAI